MVLFTSVYRDCELLPYFIKHYKSIGIQKIYCVVNRYGSTTLLDKVNNIRAGTMLSIVGLLDTPFHSTGVTQLMEAIKLNTVHEHEWYARADLDEFHYYSKPIAQVVAEAEIHECNCVAGKLIDRVSKTGKLVAIDPNVSLEKRYPIKTRITRVIMDACDDKVMLYRGRTAQMYKGCHHMKGEIPLLGNWHVDHYKWNDKAIVRMIDRIASYKITGEPYTDTATKLLKHVSINGGINLGTPGLII